MSAILCLDVGSTWTKGSLVSADGQLLGTAQHPTTPPEVLRGIDKVTAALGADSAEVLACSSAGGGLRLAVVGQERLISAEAGRRVALSSGAKVVHVSAGELDTAGLRALRAAQPDVVLLVGGTDGGDRRVLLHNAQRLATARFRAPVVLAGNRDARAAALESLAGAGRVVVPADNVLPDVGELAPDSARAAIREVFLVHVIGGKGLSRGPRFRELVRAVTPHAVLAGVSRLTSVFAGDDEAGAVLVVDVGGATTDVYSAVSIVDDDGARAVALPADRRTVEGDIGMRWNAKGVIAEALAERIVDPAEGERLAVVAEHRSSSVDWLPTDGVERAYDARLAGLATVIALRRHLQLVDGRLGPRGAGLLVFSGGVFRHADEETLSVVDAMLGGDPMLRPVLRHAARAVDRDYVLAPAGLLAEAGRVDAAGVLASSLLDVGPVS